MLVFNTKYDVARNSPIQTTANVEAIVVFFRGVEINLCSFQRSCRFDCAVCVATCRVNKKIVPCKASARTDFPSSGNRSVAIVDNVRAVSTAVEVIEDVVRFDS